MKMIRVECNACGAAFRVYVDTEPAEPDDVAGGQVETDGTVCYCCVYCGSLEEAAR